MYLIIDQPPPLSIMVFLFFLVSSASFGTGTPALPNQSIAETRRYGKGRGCRTNPSRRPGRYGKPGIAVPNHHLNRFVLETPGLPDRTFTPPDCRARTGLVRRRPLFRVEPAVSVSGFLFFCHGAQTFPVGLRGAAAFCGTNCVKLRSATAPQSGYYF